MDPPLPGSVPEMGILWLIIKFLEIENAESQHSGFFGSI